MGVSAGCRPRWWRAWQRPGNRPHMVPETMSRERVGKYTLHQVLGRGSGGTVYRAFDPFVGREVALKLAHPATAARAVDSEQGRRTFFSEAYAAGSLSHPHIVAVFDAGIEGPDSYI